MTDAHRNALLSIDGVYRYWLTREWHEPDEVRRWVCFCGLNPSTADAFVDDPTIRREIGFAKDLGANALIKVNLSAYRATDPKALVAFYRSSDIRKARGGVENVSAVRAAAQVARQGLGKGVFAAWGAVPKIFEPDQQLLEALGVPLLCLGTTKSGAPRHPLYLPRASCPMEWRA